MNAIYRGRLVDAAVNGYGFAYLPQKMAEDHLAAGTLVAVLEEFSVTFEGYYLYYTSRLQSSAAFRLVSDALKQTK